MQQKLILFIMIIMVALINAPVSVAGGSSPCVLTDGNFSMFLSPSVPQNKISLYQTLLHQYRQNWRITVNGDGLISKASIPDGIPVSGTPPVDFFTELFTSYKELLGVSEMELLNLEVSEIIETPARSLYVCSQVIDSIEVFDAYVLLKYNKEGMFIGFENHLKKLNLPYQGRATDKFDDPPEDEGTFIGSRGYVWYKDGKTITLTKVCFYALPTPGYKNPIETLCLVDSLGKVCFRKVLHVPYRRDLPLRFE